MLHEKDIQAILCKYPELIEDGLTLIGQEITIEGRRIDILYKDQFGRKLLIELKAGPIKDEHIGQIMSYIGRLLSSENPTLRVMLVGTRVPPIMQKSLDHLGIAWREITFSRLKDFLMEKNEAFFLSLFEAEPMVEPKPISVKTRNMVKTEKVNISTRTPVNVDVIVAKIKSSPSYLSFKRILPLKMNNETRAKEILLRNFNGLTGELLKDVFTLVDEPYPYFDENGRNNHRPWFGKLIKLNTRNILDVNTSQINQWFDVLTNKKLSITQRVDTLRKYPDKINGFDVGLITLMLYILDKPNHLLWFEPTHTGLLRLYPNLGEFVKSGTNYVIFNDLGKKFADQYGFEHTELDWIFSVGILPNL